MALEAELIGPLSDSGRDSSRYVTSSPSACASSARSRSSQISYRTTPGSVGTAASFAIAARASRRSASEPRCNSDSTKTAVTDPSHMNSTRTRYGVEDSPRQLDRAVDITLRRTLLSCHVDVDQRRVLGIMRRFRRRGVMQLLEQSVSGVALCTSSVDEGDAMGSPGQVDRDPAHRIAQRPSAFRLQLVDGRCPATKHSVGDRHRGTRARTCQSGMPEGLRRLPPRPDRGLLANPAIPGPSGRSAYATARTQTAIS